MNRDEILNVLRARLPVQKERFGVASLALFGSVARDAARPESDVDLLVTFAGEPTFAAYSSSSQPPAWISMGVIAVFWLRGR